MGYVYDEFKVELLVNGETQGFQIMSGAITLGKWFRASLLQTVGETVTKNEVRRFMNGVDYTFVKDGVSYLWRARRTQAINAAKTREGAS